MKLTMELCLAMRKLTSDATVIQKVFFVVFIIIRQGTVLI